MNPQDRPPAPDLWRGFLIGPEGLWRLGLVFWGGVVAQIALARAGAIALERGDGLVAVWVLVLGLVVGLFVRGQKRRAGRDLALIPVLVLFTLPANLAEMILTDPDLARGWKAAAAGAAALALWLLRDLRVFARPAGPGPGGQD